MPCPLHGTAACAFTWDDGPVSDDDLSEWTFDVHERSAGVYEGSGTHLNGASVAATGSDPDALLDRLRDEARNLRA